MLNYVVVSMVGAGYGMSHINRGYGEAIVLEGKRYNYFYREFADINQGFYIQDGIDVMKATDIWYKTIGINI